MLRRVLTQGVKTASRQTKAQSRKITTLAPAAASLRNVNLRWSNNAATNATTQAVAKSSTKSAVKSSSTYAPATMAMGTSTGSVSGVSATSNGFGEHGSSSRGFFSTGASLDEDGLDDSNTGDAMGGRENGTVKWFDSSKGFGFVARENGTDVFVHYTGIRGDGYRSLEEGQRVQFGVGQGPRGQVAEDVIILDRL